MEIIFVVFSVVQSFAISLGVGCSTLAVIYYFTSKGATIMDDTRTQMTRKVYILLRVALALMLLSTAVSAYVLVTNIGIQYFSTYALAIWTYLAVLVVNAILMKFNAIPHTIGPGFQAGTWYALGITVALPFSVVLSLSYSEFLVWYLALIGVIVLAISVYLSQQK